MKQQFEVGDGVFVAGHKPIVIIDEVRSGTTIPYTGHYVTDVNTSISFDHESAILHSKATTPTTIVTVHGNPDWKPEKGEVIGYTLLKDLPTCKAGHKIMRLGMLNDYDMSQYPDFFAPVYKEAKPIEFVKGVNIINETLEVLGCMPPEAKTIHLLCKDYRETGWDLMFVEFDGTAPLLYLGHFNSGTI